MEQEFSQERDIIVIGASTGAVEAVPQLVRNFPGDLPAAVLIALPTAPHVPHLLTAILNRVSALPAQQAIHGELMEKGRIYVAPPNRHLKIWNEHIHLDSGARENRHRPAIDALFRSAATALGPRVIGVMLGSPVEDGLEGLHAIKQNGGTAIIQDPAETLAGQTHLNTLRAGAVDFYLPLADIASWLLQLTQPAGGRLAHHAASGRAPA